LDPELDQNDEYAPFHAVGVNGSFHRDHSFIAAIPLCDWGCWNRSVFDPASGCVLRRYMDDVVEAASLPDWLEAWAASDDTMAPSDAPHSSSPGDVLRQ
jgi:hypothetical protein